MIFFYDAILLFLLFRISVSLFVQKYPWNSIWSVFFEFFTRELIKNHSPLSMSWIDVENRYLMSFFFHFWPRNFDWCSLQNESFAFISFCKIPAAILPKLFSQLSCKIVGNCSLLFQHPYWDGFQTNAKSSLQAPH